MGIIEVFKAVGLFDDAEKGRNVYKGILTRHKPSEPGFRIEVRNLSEEDYNSFVIYHTFQTMEVSNFSDEATAKLLPKSLQNSHKNLESIFGRNRGDSDVSGQ